MCGGCSSTVHLSWKKHSYKLCWQGKRKGARTGLLELWRTGPPRVSVQEGKATWGVQPVGKRPVAVLEGQNTATTPIKAPEDNYTNCTVASTGQNCLVILRKVNNLNCDFVIDTGSDISIIHPDMLPSDKQQDLCPTSGCSLRTVIGEKAPIRGTVELTLTLGTTRVAHKMWVVDI